MGAAASASCRDWCSKMFNDAAAARKQLVEQWAKRGIILDWSRPELVAAIKKVDALVNEIAGEVRLKEAILVEVKFGKEQFTLKTLQLAVTLARYVDAAEKRYVNIGADSESEGEGVLKRARVDVVDAAVTTAKERCERATEL